MGTKPRTARVAFSSLHLYLEFSNCCVLVFQLFTKN
uniref:Uncharacterized protein n=1 Tax=Lepeophtheirus salmonis TaxID=72036 RepID=A0A0K2VFC5_LEPSM